MRSVGSIAEHAGAKRFVELRGWASSHATWIDVSLALLSILPLLLTAHLPLTDLPNHLARQYVMRDLPGSATLQTYYLVHWTLQPNLALEVFVILARQFLSIDLAVRVFCILTVLLLLLGTRLLNRRFAGATSRIYRVAPLLCYGGPFQYGFLSYCFGVGLGLVLFGCYLQMRFGTERRSRGSGSRPLWIIFLIASGFVVMLCHLVAFGLFAIAVGVCELTANAADINGVMAERGGAARRMMLPIACLVPVFVLFMALSPTTATVTTTAVHFSTWHQKLRSVLSITYFTRPMLEGGLLGLAVAGAAAALATSTVRLHATGLLIVLAMILVWLMTPDVAIEAGYIDYRFPWAIAFFLLASVIPGPNYSRAASTFGRLFGVLAVARIVVISALWMHWEPTLNAIDQALGQLPQGARLMVVEGRGQAGTVYRDPDLANVSAYSVIRREAFDPGMFAGIAGQILQFKPHYSPLRVEDGFSTGGNPSTLMSIRPDYQFLLVLRPEMAAVGKDIPLRCVSSGPMFQLFEVAQPDEAQDHAACRS